MKDRADSTTGPGSGPHGVEPTVWSTVSMDVACSKCVQVGRSWASWPDSPLLGHTLCSVSRASCSSGPQHMVTCAQRVPEPPLCSYLSITSRSGL